MSKSRIDSHLSNIFKRQCDVKWMTLSSICKKICSGGTPNTSHRSYYEGNIPWLRTQEVDWNDVFDTDIKITEEAVANSSAKLIPSNCVIIAMYGATAGKCCINRIPLTTNQACCNLEVDENLVLSKYVYYWVCEEYVNIKRMGEGSQSNINAKKIKEYSIPVPSIEIQKEIVRILDDYTEKYNELQSNLQEELQLRKEEYEYWSDMILSFNSIDGGVDSVGVKCINELIEKYCPDGVEWKTINDIGVKFIRGVTYNKSQESYDGNEDALKILRANNITLSSNTLNFDDVKLVKSSVKIRDDQWLKKEDILICAGSGSKEHIGKVAYISEDMNYSFGGFMAVIRPSILINARYLFCILKSRLFLDYLKSELDSATINNLNSKIMHGFLFPVPPLEIQKEIVRILGDYTEKYNELRLTIEAEMEARREEYEYCRDRLLTFKKKTA